MLKPGLRQVEDARNLTATQTGPNERWRHPGPADPVGFLAVYDRLGFFGLLLLVYFGKGLLGALISPVLAFFVALVTLFR